MDMESTDRVVIFSCTCHPERRGHGVNWWNSDLLLHLSSCKSLSLPVVSHFLTRHLMVVIFTLKLVARPFTRIPAWNWPIARVLCSGDNLNMVSYTVPNIYSTQHIQYPTYTLPNIYSIQHTHLRAEVLLWMYRASRIILGNHLSSFTRILVSSSV